ncbi:MAG: 4-(cytidine 5'-diphospho)-2-C-methyl-D-erythritol kinase [Oligoflexia bacterium]|nr:4-(cytidine 5'-diphospho)-2-C-methyl-D-erythritol kinase [Oligoflexia bacterium]
MKLQSPSKLNLWLKIIGRREDGYHLLDSLFVPIDLCDEIEISVSDEDDVRFFDSNHNPLQIQNSTVHKALGLLRGLMGFPFLKIQVTKHIPIGAGLGGASGNGAALLTYVSKQFGPLSPSDLASLAKSIGADVPFFLEHQPAYVTGIGDQITKVAVPKMHFVVGFPGFGCATPDVYRWFDEQNGLKPNQTFDQKNMTLPLKVFDLSSEEVIRRASNDLEHVVEAKHPEIKRLKDAMINQGALMAQMTGSGSCVFGLFNDRRRADEAREWLKAHHPESFQFFSASSSGN